MMRHHMLGNEAPHAVAKGVVVGGKNGAWNHDFQ
jgi:hypothetical protein